MKITQSGIKEEEVIVEIKGTGNHNKGAEMMLLTILQELGGQKTKFTVAPVQGVCEYAFYSRLRLYPKLWLRIKIDVNNCGRLIYIYNLSNLYLRIGSTSPGIIYLRAVVI